MKQAYCLLLLSLGLVAACSKKEEDASAAAPAAPAEAAPAAEPKRNWDAVVAEVARIRAMRPLPDDKRARMLQLQDELMAASNSDPAAREAWANLSRIINNR
jgi:hypothetical protein